MIFGRCCVCLEDMEAVDDVRLFRVRHVAADGRERDFAVQVCPRHHNAVAVRQFVDELREAGACLGCVLMRPRVAVRVTFPDDDVPDVAGWVCAFCAPGGAL